MAGEPNTSCTPLLFSQWKLNQSVLNGSSSLRRMGGKNTLSRKLAFRLFVILCKRHKGLTYCEKKWAVFYLMSTLLSVVQYWVLKYWDVGGRMKFGGMKTVLSWKRLLLLYFWREKRVVNTVCKLCFWVTVRGIWVTEKKEVWSA